MVQETPGFSKAVTKRLIAPLEDNSDEIWRITQETIWELYGDSFNERRREKIIKDGILSPRNIWICTMEEIDPSTRAKTGDLVGILDLRPTISLSNLFGAPACAAIGRALRKIVLTRISKDEIVYDPISQKWLLRSEAQGFFNGYLRQMEEFASNLNGKPMGLLTVERQ